MDVTFAALPPRSLTVIFVRLTPNALGSLRFADTAVTPADPESVLKVDEVELIFTMAEVGVKVSVGVKVVVAVVVDV